VTALLRKKTSPPFFAALLGQQRHRPSARHRAKKDRQKDRPRRHLRGGSNLVAVYDDATAFDSVDAAVAVRVLALAVVEREPLRYFDCCRCRRRCRSRRRRRSTPAVQAVRSLGLVPAVPILETTTARAAATASDGTTTAALSSSSSLPPPRLLLSSSGTTAFAADSCAPSVSTVVPHTHKQPPPLLHFGRF